MNLRRRLATVLNEPLVHFLIAGGAIFAIYGWAGDTTDAESRRIIVDEKQVQRLASMWSQTWQRPPSSQELDGSIRDYIKEEIYYREARRLGLDEDDAVIRRRLRSKMEFLARSETENMTPTDTELQAWLDRYPARYATDPVISFDSVYIGLDKGEDAARARALRILAQLKSGRNFSTMGDDISLPRSMAATSQILIARQYGEDFASALVNLPIGSWSGPVASGFGVHLVRVDKIYVSRKPALGEVRRQVENDWRSASSERRELDAYQTLLNSYEIEIEQPG